MPERNILAEEKIIQFEGLMDLRKVGATIYHWLKEHHYDMVERVNFEQVFEEGKQIEVDMEPMKKYGDYVRGKIRIRIWLTELKEVEVDLNSVKRKLWKGKAKIEFTPILITDVTDRWNESAAGFFFRTLIDKFLMKSQISQAEGQCMSDCTAIMDEVKSLLNLYRFIPENA